MKILISPPLCPKCHSQMGYLTASNPHVITCFNMDCDWYKRPIKGPYVEAEMGPMDEPVEPGPPIPA